MEDHEYVAEGNGAFTVYDIEVAAQEKAQCLKNVEDVEDIEDVETTSKCVSELNLANVP